MLNVTTHQDQGERDYQEDRWTVVPNLGNCAHLTLCLVCDGHGGFQCSTFLANQYPIQLAKEIQDQQEDMMSSTTPTQKRAPFLTMMGKALETCIENWDRYCFGDAYGTIVDDKSKAAFFASIDAREYEKAGKVAGSTLVAMLINTHKSKAYLIHIGDSRCAFLLGDLIAQTLDDNVKIHTREQRAGFEYEVEEERLQGRLCMECAIGDNDEDLFGVVKRTYHVQKINFAKKTFRAVIASDGLWDVMKNQQALFEPYPHAEAIAKKGLQIMKEQKEESLQKQLEEEKDEKVKKALLEALDALKTYKPVFEDNVTIIYIQKKAHEEGTSSANKQKPTPLTVVVPAGSEPLKKAKPPTKPTKAKQATDNGSETTEAPIETSAGTTTTTKTDLQSLMAQIASLQSNIAALDVKQPSKKTPGPKKKAAKPKSTSSKKASAKQTAPKKKNPGAKKESNKNSTKKASKTKASKKKASKKTSRKKTESKDTNTVTVTIHAPGKRAVRKKDTD